MIAEVYQVLLTVIGVCFAVFSFLLVILLWRHNLRIAHRQLYYNEEKNRSELESMRASFEARIYDLTDRLLATENRWRDLNHLLISAQKEPLELLREPKKVYLSEFLKANGFRREDLVIDKDLIFVLTPFHRQYEEVFEVIVRVCRGVNLRCLRGDEENIREDIFHHILRLMMRARLIIANIDGRNPNVFYELGVAQAMDKGIILISSSLSELPVDLVAKRMVVFKSISDLKMKLKDELAKALIKT